MHEICRSILILPVNNARFVEKAYLRGADGVMLDLEDSVPPAEKESARKLIKDYIPLVGLGGSKVFVRINKDPSLLPYDVDASVHKGLDAIALPNTESAEEVHDLETQLEKLEEARGIGAGRIKLHILIETPRGVLRAQEIAGASSRIVYIGLGNEDYCMELGVEPSPEGTEIFYPLSYLVTVCKTAGISAKGLLGSIGGFRDLEAFERAANAARQLGCDGAGCIHPNQVEVLNQVFSPSPEKIEYAHLAVKAFEEGVGKGTASVNLNGKMVDIPIYNRAKLILEHAVAIDEIKQRKARALAKASKRG